MKRLVIALLALAFIGPVHAQQQSVTVWTPHLGGLVTATPADMSASVMLPADVASNSHVYISNNGANLVYVVTGDMAVAATIATGIPISPGAGRCINLLQGDTYIAYITLSGMNSADSLTLEQYAGCPVTSGGNVVSNGAVTIGAVTQGGAFNVGQNGNWTVRNVGSAGGAFDSVAGAAQPPNVLSFGISDSVNLQRWFAPVILGDGVNGNNMGSVGSWMWNGLTWDRVRGSAAGGLLATIAASALPAGAATETKQDTGNSALATIATNTGSSYPAGAVPVTNSAVGGTDIVAATLPASVTLKTYICGFAIRANADAAATTNSQVSGTVGGSLDFYEFVAPSATGIGEVKESFNPCIPSSAINTAIVVTSAPAGMGGKTSVAAWGYQGP